VHNHLSIANSRIKAKLFRFLFADMPEYLTDKDRPTEKVRCPVHGFIHYSKNERVFIDHPAFRRLKSIRQLALTCYVYPGAMHSRFEHSLGVMEMATRAFDSLANKHKPKILRELSAIPSLQEQTLERSRQIVRLLALLHDIGHPAFSHAAESVLPLQDHEAVSVHVIGHILGPMLDELFFTGTSELLVKLMEKRPEVTFLRQFVVSEIDMDRTDYLRRDSLHCGVDYGHFDFHRLIEALTVIENPETRQVQIGLERGGEHIFEALILARYQMSTQVYYHRLRRIYDRYLTDYMSFWAPEHYHTPEDILNYDDMDLLVQMKADAKVDGPRQELARRITERDHHRMIYQSGDSTNVITMRRVKAMFNHLKADFPDVDLIIDVGQGAIHKQLIPNDEADDPASDPLYLAERDGTNPQMISLESGILQKIPKRFRNVRIYGFSQTRNLGDVKADAYRQMNGVN
jgi:HD superfamily phosphohydrolase